MLVNALIMIALIVPAASAGLSACSSPKVNKAQKLDLPKLSAAKDLDDPEPSKSPTPDAEPGDRTEFPFKLAQEGFDRYLHPFLEEGCQRCHGNKISTQFALKDTEIALKNLVKAEVVNFDEPADSDLVLRMLEINHNCPNDCQEDGQTMLESIEAWTETFSFDGGKTESKPAEAVKQAISDGEDEVIQAGGPDFAFTEAASAVPANGWQITQTRDPQNMQPIPEDGVLSYIQTNNNAAGSLTYTFEVEEEGLYVLWIRAVIPQDNAQLQLALDGQALPQFNPRSTGDAWDWLVASADPAETQKTILNLTAGSHTIVLSCANQVPNRGIRINRLVVSKDQSTVNDYRLSTQSVKKLEYDLPKSKAKMVIQLSEFGPSHYQINSISIETEKKIKIQGIEPYINGKAQGKTEGKTWRNIDIEIKEAGTHSVPTAGVILKADKGIDDDILGFGFKTIK